SSAFSSITSFTVSANSTSLSDSNLAAGTTYYYRVKATNAAGSSNYSNVSNAMTQTDFGISATPASVTINRGSNASYTVTITAMQGFTGTVALSVSGLPKFASAQFNPASVSNSGNSVLTVTTTGKVARGTYTLNIKGTSGSRVHSASVNLVIQ